MLDAAAFVWAANPGMQGGRALAEILLGLTEPSGRLPISFAVHVGQQPTYYNQLRGQHGSRYADLTQRTAFAFGEGLSEDEPGSLRNVQVVIDDADATRATLLEAGVDASEVDDQPWGRFVTFPDPDGNRWALQELPAWSGADGDGEGETHGGDAGGQVSAGA